MSVLSGNAAAFLICLERQVGHNAVCEVVGRCERGETLTIAMMRSHARLHPREKRRVKPILQEHQKRLVKIRDEKRGGTTSGKTSEPYVGVCSECGETTLCRDTPYTTQVTRGPQHKKDCSCWVEHVPDCSCAECRQRRSVPLS